METELSPRSNKNLENGATFINFSEADERWLALVKEKTKKSPKLLNNSAGKGSCCIFRVPNSLVEINEEAYQPRIVSIGPYHHGKQHLKMIEEHKWRFLGAVLARTQPHKVDEIFKAVASEEEKIRECYSETIEYSRHDLIEMMVLDGCFIIELFRKVARIVERDDDDPIFNMSWVFYSLIGDLLRLENQIPFFILQSLFQLSISSTNEDRRSLTQLALEFFDYSFQRPNHVLEGYNNLVGKHLLDLFRLTLVPPCKGDPRILKTKEEDPQEERPFLQLIQSAKKLHVAGIQFNPKETTTFLDIKFRNGVLEIPTLTVDDFTTSILLLNCVAFEECYSHCTKDVTSYVAFMGCLVNTPSDAGFLCDEKVIENYFGTDEQVAKFFSNIGNDVAFDIQQSYLAEIFEGVNKHYRNNWHVRWAGFKYTYFDTPWSFMSALAAFVLLMLTMLQSYFAVYAYFNPPKG